MKLKELQIKGRKKLENIDDGNIKSDILLKNLLNMNNVQLVINSENEVEEKIEKKFFEGLEKIKEGFPVQYIVNKQNFMGFEFFVNENVLIPQPDTEVLVENVINCINSNDKILDLCTGSGAIGISIAKLVNNVKVDLLDISVKALEVAKINAERIGVNVKFIESNLFENVEEKYNIIVSNPPYIKTKVIEELETEVKNEPILALDGGADGLDFYKKIAKDAKKYLVQNGILALEIGYDQNLEVTEILKLEGYKNIKSIKDYGNNDRVIIANI